MAPHGQRRCLLSREQPRRLEDNTLADGIFHAVTWLVTLAGTLVAVRAWRRGELAPPWRLHGAGLLAGWGIFNVIDSVNHFVLGLHHIRDDLGGPVGWDVGFLVLGLAQVAIGFALASRWRHRGVGAETDRIERKRPQPPLDPQRAG